MTLTPASIEQFLKSMSANGASPNTIRGYRADLTGLMLAKPRLMEVWDEELVKQYLTTIRTTAAPKTVLRKISAIRAWAYANGYRHALKGYRAPRPARAIPHPLPNGIEAVVEMAHSAKKPEHKALVALCGLCGLRVGEALSVRPSNFDLTEMVLTVKGKGDRSRIVPLSKMAWVFIEPAYTRALADDQRIVPITDRPARALLTRLGRKAHVPRSVASHDLRATFATAAYNKTKDLRAVQEVLGHSSSNTTEIYTGISVDAMRKAVEVV